MEIRAIVLLLLLSLSATIAVAEEGECGVPVEEVILPGILSEVL